MSQVSRPMQIALLATVLLAAVWFVALRPKSSNAGGSAAAPPPAAQATSPGASGAAPGVAGLKTAIDKAHGAVATASGDAQRAAQSSADGSQPAAAPSAPAGQAPARPPAAGPAPAAHAPAAVHAPATGRRLARGAAGHRAARHHAHGPVAIVKAALGAHLAVAIAFVDDGTADARAVAQEMRFVPTFGGRAVVVTAPLSRLSDYDFITNAVQVTVAPTVVIVDRRGRATTIVGFADRGEIAQRLADAVAVKPAR